MCYVAITRQSALPCVAVHYIERALLRLADCCTLRAGPCRVLDGSSLALYRRPYWADPGDVQTGRKHLPILDITWAIERFPHKAALDRSGRNDRAIAVVVSFRSEVRSGGLRPNVPRGLTFFWGETETVGATYTCIPPRQGPADERL